MNHRLKLDMSEISFYPLFWTLSALLAYSTVLVAYRLFFHPLARFPGPKSTAATYWYECFYDIFAGGGGQYINYVEKIHDIYGLSQVLCAIFISVANRVKAQSYA